MPSYCIVQGCTSKTYKLKNRENESPVSFFKIPKNETTKKKWAMALLSLNEQSGQLTPSGRICAAHFLPDCFVQSGLANKRLKPDAVPSLFPKSLTEEPKAERDENSISETTYSQSAREQSKSPDTSSNIKSESRNNEKSKYPMEYEPSTSQPITPGTPTKSKILVRYPGDITEEKINEMTPRTIRKTMNILKSSCEKKNTVIKRLRVQASRHKRKIESLKDLLLELKGNTLISPNAYNVLQTVADEEPNFIKEIEQGKIKGKYSPSLRAFALTLHFYSPKAYNYVRERFRNKLPAPSTIRAWYSNTNGSPGFNEDAITALKNKCTEGKEIFGCLMMDEMGIRKQEEWNHRLKRYVGYVDYGTVIPDPDNLPLAREALVYLVNGVNERWKIPVAYFFTNGLTAEEKTEITLKVLNFIDASGVQIIAFTCDGCPANISMFSHLGADIYNGKPYFRHPLGDYDVQVFLDAAHMIKLIRNVLASKGILYDKNNEPIEWKYFTSLVQIQEKLYLHLGNKLTKKHVAWDKHKMNVKLATQTLSESVAVAFEQLQADGHPDFQGCSATVKFIRMGNNVFDCLNSRSLFSYGFKKPVNPSTADNIFQLFTEAKDYFKNMKLNYNGKSIITARCRTGFLGLITDMESTQKLYTDYVCNGSLKYILTYKFSQDHLETFFSSIRSMGGYNNNPNCTHFTAAYIKLLHRNEVKSSADANCLYDYTSILSVSSKRYNPSERKEDDIQAVCVDDIPLEYISSTANHAILYIAGFVERSILNKIKCEPCCELINECAAVKSDFIERKSLGALRFPREDTYKIICTTEKVVNIYRLDDSLNNKNIYNKIMVNTMRNLNLDRLFPNFDGHVRNLDVLENHKYFVIRMIIETFIKVKLSHMGKVNTTRRHTTFLRSNLTKTIIFSGQ